ncbi:extracellular solute-binding protein [Paenibacillus sp. GCM10027626]|uniref:extracellular solute-binding protein n=1 Tax=Paenibacillus sp. GCM10027626 TaxID=3273411 RepID=UPI00362886F6
MPRHTTMRLLTVASLSALLLTACNTEPKETASQGNETKPSPATDKQNEMIDISFMNFAYTIFPPSQSKGVEAIKEKFHANIQAEFILQSDYKNKLGVVMASGNMPDVTALTELDSNFYKWAKQGAFLPLDDYVSQYETLKNIPESILNQFKVNGKLYAIPMYSPTYTFSGLIRQDWLDNLNLKMPTNYEELLKVAIAFTKDDPNKNGKNDTYGFALGENINPGHNMGAYWSGAWYHKNDKGQYIPGTISEGRKEVIETLHQAYKEGAVTKDFAALNWAQVNKEFYSGNAGIFIGTPKGMIEDYYTGLLSVNPEAKLVSIPYFEAPDGKQGNLNGPGYLGMLALSSKLKDQPEKINKILEIMDYGREFIPMSERTPDNEKFDWLMGGEEGYEMIDGLPVQKEGWEAIAPVQYMLHRHEYWNPWAPSNDANEYEKTYKSAEMKAFIHSIDEMEKTYNRDPYDDPSYGVYSETNSQKGAELNKYLIGEQTKMIAGHRPIAEWDQMVQEWMDRGGAQLVEEINAGIAERDAAK